MKVIFLALFVVAVTAVPLPGHVSGRDAVKMTMNGVPDGTALDVVNVVDIKLKEHADGEVLAADLLHPYIAEDAAAATVSAPNEVVDDKAELARNVHPMPIVKPSPGFEPIEVPGPVIPGPIVVPPRAVPEVVDEPEKLPVAAAQFNNPMYNDGHVQVQYNGPEEPGMLDALQNWFQGVVNYFSPASPAAIEGFPEPKHLHIH